MRHSSSVRAVMSDEIFCAYEAVKENKMIESVKKILCITPMTPVNKIKPREIDFTLKHGVKYIQIE